MKLLGIELATPHTEGTAARTLVLLGENPLDNIRNTRKSAKIILGGRVVE